MQWGHLNFSRWSGFKLSTESRDYPKNDLSQSPDELTRAEWENFEFKLLWISWILHRKIREPFREIKCVSKSTKSLSLAIFSIKSFTKVALLMALCPLKEEIASLLVLEISSASSTSLLVMRGEIEAYLSGFEYCATLRSLSKISIRAASSETQFKRGRVTISVSPRHPLTPIQLRDFVPCKYIGCVIKLWRRSHKSL